MNQTTAEIDKELQKLQGRVIPESEWMEVQEKVRLTHQIQTHILNRAIYPNNIATQVIRKLLGERYDDKYIEKGYTYTVLLRTYYYSYFNDSETPPKLRQYTQSQVPIGFLVDKTQTT